MKTILIGTSFGKLDAISPGKNQQKFSFAEGMWAYLTYSFIRERLHRSNTWNAGAIDILVWIPKTLAEMKFHGHRVYFHSQRDQRGSLFVRG